MLTLIEVACCCFVAYLVQRHVESWGASLLWQFLLSIPPAAIVLEAFADFRRRIQLEKTKAEALKLSEEEGIYQGIKKIAREHHIWCQNEKVTKTTTLCVYLDCQYKNYSSDIPNGCSKCRLFQITDQNTDWNKAKRTHDFATVNPKEVKNEVKNSKLA
jgi:hypothetical protein